MSEGAELSPRSERRACRSCEAAELRPVLSLGPTPLADPLPTTDDPAYPEVSAPLDLVLCPACGLVQLADVLAPEAAFGPEYSYFSSVSSTLLENARALALQGIERFHLGAGSFVVEIASNDGYLLRNFRDRGIPALGIDPAAGPAAVARRAGIDTIVACFTADLARRLAADGRLADLIIANNVLTHVADPNDMVRGIAALLGPDGAAVLEMPYLGDMMEQCEFDWIIHEQINYFSLTALDSLFRRQSLTVNDVRRTPVHAGSIRIEVSRRPGATPAVARLLEDERAHGYMAPETFAAFARRVREVRADLRALLLDLKAAGHRLAAYGAAAKGNTLLNFCGIGREVLDFVVDRTPFKQGRFTPGTRLPILPPGALLDEPRPDFVLILPWNFADEILEQQAEYRRRGGRFILPMPRPRVL